MIPEKNTLITCKRSDLLFKNRKSWDTISLFESGRDGFERKFHRNWLTKSFICGSKNNE